MSESVQAVLIDDKIYIGGGFTMYTMDVGIVLMYTLRNSSWTKLPYYRNHFCGMTTVNQQLVLVGGRNVLTKKVSNMLGVWNEESQTWTHPFPTMPKSQCSPSVISYQKWLIVAGGHDDKSLRSNKVELLDTLSGQWYEGSPLPCIPGCSGMSSAISDNMWYLSRGFTSVDDKNNRVFSVCLDKLISQAVTPSATATSPSPWQTLTDTPLTGSTVLALNGALLAVGGYKNSTIFCYQPSSRSWVKVGCLPIKRWQCACVVLPNSGEIFVAGGVAPIGDSKRVDIGAIII